MKRHLRPSIKWFLVGIVVSQGLSMSLNAYNRHLEGVSKALELKVEDYIVSHKIIEIESLTVEPCSTSSAKSYMDYRAITDTTSKQYELVQNMNIKNGMLLDEDGYIGVALGSQFGEVGSKWVFELSSGEYLYTIKVDEKDDKDTINGCQHKIDGSVIEFVVDTETTIFSIGSNGLILEGNFNNHPWFNGEIVSVRKEVNND